MQTAGHSAEEYRPTGLIGYVNRNRLWLTPLLVAGYAWLFPYVLGMAKDAGTYSFPTWVWPTLQIFGFVGAGLGAKLTDTTSADVVQAICTVLGLVAVLYVLL